MPGSVINNIYTNGVNKSALFIHFFTPVFRHVNTYRRMFAVNLRSELSPRPARLIQVIHGS